MVEFSARYSSGSKSFATCMVIRRRSVLFLFASAFGLLFLYRPLSIYIHEVIEDFTLFWVFVLGRPGCIANMVAYRINVLRSLVAHFGGIQG